MDFPSSYEELIYLRTYSRWLDEEERRENWEETVNRYRGFFKERVPKNQALEFDSICDSIMNFEVMPSMRSLWTAGKALERDNVASYNCATLAVNTIKSFSELLQILLNGCGCGFSVERQYINKLPEIPNNISEDDETVIIFADSKLGWSEGFNKYIRFLYNGIIPTYDLSKIRPKGTRLKTFGGRASGPESLEDLLIFTRELFKKARGRKLSSIECHDLCCKIAYIVVVGGNRRSACVSLSNLSDQRMAKAKVGQFWEENPQRIMANNSVAYTEKPDHVSFIEEWLNLVKSRSGERGIFNREGAKEFIKQIGRRDHDHEFQINPCVTGDTLVKTDRGDVKITDIVKNKEKYKAVTYDIDTGKIENESIIFADKTRETEQIIEIELDDGKTLKLTPDHKVYTENRGYIKAAKLNESDVIICFQ